MKRMLRLVMGLVALMLIACGARGPAQTPAAAATAPALNVAAPEVAKGSVDDDPTDAPVIDMGDAGPIPVSRSDPHRGHNDALVTIVEFAEFQCPFCGRVKDTLAKLLQDYGPTQVRLVWKNSPLPFHPQARPSAVLARMVFERGGNAPFWRAHDLFFSDQARLADSMNDAAAVLGGSMEDLKASSAWGAAEAKIDADLALGKSIDVSGVPAFFVNGIYVSGAQPYERFAAIIDEQLPKARAAIEHGTPRGRIYAELTKAQFVRPAASPAKAPEDNRPRQIPIAGSPVRGKPSALVTMVMFSDFQCPFCGRVAGTLKQLTRDYGDSLRIVFKHNPLPFHPHAEPAAELALEARAQRGDAGFWAAYELMFAKECTGNPSSTTRQACMDAGGTWLDHQTRLEDADLFEYAKKLGLSQPAVAAAIASKKHAAAIERDQELAEEMRASGTPAFFINGRLLVGAQPIDAFKKVIDEELVRAKELTAKGVPATRVYDTLQATALGPQDETERVKAPATTAANPSRGPARAKVVIQMFADFQCPFCSRVLPSLHELEKAYPNKIRIVWRNMPLPMHANAPLAAEAALEAFHQKGSAGFWAMHDLLFASSDAQGLERQALEGYAAQIGLNLPAFTAALDARTHQREVEADVALASNANITGTPTILINDYVVSGAQPYGKFRRLVERALSEAK